MKRGGDTHAAENSNPSAQPDPGPDPALLQPHRRALSAAGRAVRTGALGVPDRMQVLPGRRPSGSAGIVQSNDPVIYA